MDTVTVGSGANTVTLGGGADKFILSVANTSSAAFTTITDIGSGDTIQLTANITNSGAKLGAKLSSGLEDYQTYLNAAAALGGGKVSWFQFGGNTYIVEDNDNGNFYAAGTDVVIKLTGNVDLSTATFATKIITIA